MKKIIIFSVLTLMFLGSVFTTFARDISARDFLELLISSGVISSDKASAARTALYNVQNDVVDLSGPFCFNFNRNLGIGTNNKDVAALHRALSLEGLYNGALSTSYNEVTASSVTAFQEKYKADILTPIGLSFGTGHVGSMSRAKLNALYGCAVTGKITPEAVSEAKVGSFYSKKLTFKADGLDSPRVVWTMSGVLPAGLTLTNRGAVCIDFIRPNGGECIDGNQALLYGTPTTIGDYSFSVTATLENGKGTTTKNYTLSVKDVPSTLHVIEPKGGETWSQGSAHSIRWEGVSGPVDIKAEIYIACAPVCKVLVPKPFTIASGVMSQPGTPRSVQWTVGTVEDKDRPMTDGNYKILICKTDSDLCDRSENFFTIKTQTGSGAPVINGITAPTNLSVGEMGTWKIKASNLQNGSLSYSVRWGDEQTASGTSAPVNQLAAPEVQSTTFTHSYSSAGTYTVRFTVTDQSGRTAETGTTVIVRSANANYVSVRVLNGDIVCITTPCEFPIANALVSLMYRGVGPMPYAAESMPGEPYHVLATTRTTTDGVAVFNYSQGSDVEYIFSISADGFASTTIPARFNTTTSVSLHSAKPLTLSVVTDKTMYHMADPITMTLTATNSGASDTVVHFNSGCATNYSLGSFNSSQYQMCTMALMDVTIPAHGSKQWTTVHNLSQYPLSFGNYTLTSRLIGIGEAQTSLTIIQ